MAQGAASIQGQKVDEMLFVTLIITGIVFVIYTSIIILVCL